MPSAPMMSPIPMAPPAARTPGILPPQNGGGLGGILGNFFNQEMTPDRQAMIMQLVQAGMGSAQGSGSPLAALLAPMAGAAIGRSTLSRADEYKKQTEADEKAKKRAEREKAVDALLNGLDTSKLGGARDVLVNPDSPDFATRIASSRVDSLVNPKPKAKTGGGRLYGEFDIDGVLHGRDGAGQMRPYLDAQGNPIKAGAFRKIGAEKAADDFTATLGGGTSSPALDSNDPLGIL